MLKLKNIISQPVKILSSSLSTSVCNARKKTNKKSNVNINVNRRRKLPYGLRANVWTKYNGEVFNAKCYVEFCEQVVTPFTFEVGHDIPVSKGGSDSITNLRPICRNCNNSMSNDYTIAEYSNKFK
jgi:5-methylcytosine-specific restriction endonuclease McrA